MYSLPKICKGKGIPRYSVFFSIRSIYHNGKKNILKLYTFKWLPFHFSLSCIGEGNGNPLQCSCLENPRNGRAWWAAVCGVAQSRTRLKRLSSMYVCISPPSWASLLPYQILQSVCTDLTMWSKGSCLRPLSWPSALRWELRGHPDGILPLPGNQAGWRPSSENTRRLEAMC